ncbi:hypothetical protein [Arthrobacter oryzae]|uniref:hypothetical protein n=1 Tax=Arthrobacter oryzae TaxID=409290 RepID=UPI0030C9447D
MSEEQASAVPATEKDAKSRPYLPSPGSESTREMREMSRRRRDAEEKLQQHLQEADHLHEEHMKAHQRETQLADEGAHHEGGHHEGGHHEGGAPAEGTATEGGASEGEAPDQGEAGTKPAE